MPKVEVTVSYMDAFALKRQFKYDDEDWAEMSREQRQELINEDAEAFMREVVEWDYKVL